jgi:ribosomal protein L27
MEKLKLNISYHAGENNISIGDNSVIYTYGKGYTSFEELEQDKKIIDENPIALLWVLKKNSKQK